MPLQRSGLVTRPHDAGGKIKLPLLRGCRGDAAFDGDNEQFRPWLTRDWVPEPSKLWLWIGQNPSTAAKNLDDPTIRKEMKFTIKGGGRSYVKCNVMDFRASKPPVLLTVPQQRSNFNLQVIIGYAKKADKIVIAWGAIHPKLQHYADETLATLRSHDKTLWCVGTTGGGAPRHPLYVADNTDLEIYK